MSAIIVCWHAFTFVMNEEILFLYVSVCLLCDLLYVDYYQHSLLSLLN
jgi:hypothetical protein